MGGAAAAVRRMVSAVMGEMGVALVVGLGRVVSRRREDRAGREVVEGLRECGSVVAEN